jgi:hypothetical protein
MTVGVRTQTGYALLISVGALLLGCQPPTDPVAPAELEYIAQHASDFGGNFATFVPLSKVLGNSVAIDLATVAGCWGSVLVNPPEMPPGRYLAFYRFDPATEWYESWDLQELFGVLPLQSHHVGAFRIVDGDYLELTTEQSWTNNPQTGAMEPDPLDQPVTFARYAVLAQDRLGVYLGGEDPPTVEKAAFQVYTQFQCP